MSDEANEACGVFAVYAPGKPVSHLTYLGIYALQHRGQESAGIAVSDGHSVMVMKDMPKPRQTFVLVKGAYDKHGDVVTAATPA